MPFAGLVSDLEGSTSIFQTAMNNFMDVLSGLIKGIFGILMKPIYPILNIFTAILDHFLAYCKNLGFSLMLSEDFYLDYLRNY